MFQCAIWEHYDGAISYWMEHHIGKQTNNENFLVRWFFRDVIITLTLVIIAVLLITVTYKCNFYIIVATTAIFQTKLKS